MAVKIRLKRMGKIRAPHYRIVVADSRKKRDGRVIEEIGKYHPKEEPSLIEVESERAQYWLGVGAQPTEAVAALLKITGDWQSFRGEPGESTLKVAEPRREKADVFNDALKESARETEKEAVTAKKAAKKSAAKKTAKKAASEGAPETASEAVPVAETGDAGDAAAEAPAAEAPAAETPAAETPAAEAPAAETPADVPGVETPEGATEEAEVAEVKALDAEAAEKAEETSAEKA